MLFRSEAEITRWCAHRERALGAVVDLDRLWALAQRWYNDRLDLGWARRAPAERQAILDEVGLKGPFWQLS